MFQTGNILAGAHNIIGLFDLILRVGLELGFRESKELVKVTVRVNGLVGIVRVSVLHCAYKSPHKDRRTRMCVCVRVFVKLFDCLLQVFIGNSIYASKFIK